MVDLYAEVATLKTRVDKLEAHTMSGMPNTSIADRFDGLSGRMDMMGQCLLERMDEAKAETAKSFAEVRDDLSLLRADQERAMLRFERIDSELAEVKTDVAELKTDVAELKTDVAELKTDVAELKTDVAELKTDVAELKTDVAQLKTGMSDIKSMLVSLGAQPPVTN